MLTAFAALMALSADPAYTVVILDPMAAELSCPCVKGYAQRDYKRLGEFLAKQTGRAVNIHYAETLAAALSKKTEGKADLVIGKDSVVRVAAKEAKLGLDHVLALTDKEGKTTMTGLFVVAAKDPALTAGDLKDYRIIFGLADADEKYATPLKLLEELGVKAPATKETCPSCSTAAGKLLEAHKAGEKAAAVISSYAQPLLEGCGTVKKGELRVVGETDAVPFVSVFVNAKLGSDDRAALLKALLAIAKDKDLCKAMETKAGFVEPGAKKKG
ncbi:MAG: phosphate/phosphite/phosphonate ABC transporter substrate-binding protein [Gemmataceae bacterium]|nr:phosphate/phosphite/phosphonate ABC transporter substrate-binding protein [Gemmataceae bacterium]